MAIGACPTFWLDKQQTDTLKTLAKNGGPGAIDLLRAGSPAPHAGVIEDLSLKTYFRGAEDAYIVTLLIVNTGTEPLLLTEPPSMRYGDIVYAPVVISSLNSFTPPRGADHVGTPTLFVKQDNSDKSYSWDTNNEWGNYWIDAAPWDALGAGSSSVGVFQFAKFNPSFSGVGAAIKFSSYSRFDHYYVGGERNLGAKANSGAISLADCGSAADFYNKFVNGAERYTDSTPSGAYCGCSSKTDYFNCITAIIP